MGKIGIKNRDPNGVKKFRGWVKKLIIAIRIQSWDICLMITGGMGMHDLITTWEFG
jgi:hypothetical protein